MPKAAPPSEPPMPRGSSMSRKSFVSGKNNPDMIPQQPCKYLLKGTWTISLCEYWHPPERQFCRTESGCKAGDKCLFPHNKFEKQPNKKQKKSFQNEKKRRKSAVANVTTVPKLGCVSQDSELSGSPKGTKFRRNPKRKVLGLIRRVRFTQCTLR